MSDLRDEKFEPVDFQKIKLARELEQEIGGIFGIERRDIEKAVDRLWAGEIRYPETNSTQILTDPVKRAIQALDLLESAARDAADNPESAACIKELLPFYSKRIEKLISGSQDNDFFT